MREHFRIICPKATDSIDERWRKVKDIINNVSELEKQRKTKNVWFNDTCIGAFNLGE